MITVEEFLKEKDIAKHIVNTYVSYATKIDECRKIVDLNSYKEVNDEKIYWKNTPGQYFMFVIRLIANYTDIDMGERILDSYDSLNKENMINEIISTIPQTEYEEWRTLLQMCDDDAYENLRSMPSWLETKFDSMKLVFDSMSEVLGQIGINTTEEKEEL